MVLFPGQWHTYYPLRQTGWTEYYIGFEGPAIDTIVGDAFLSQERQILEVGINEELVSLFSALWKWQKRIKYLPSNTFPESYFT